MDRLEAIRDSHEPFGHGPDPECPTCWLIEQVEVLRAENERLTEQRRTARAAEIEAKTEANHLRRTLDEQKRHNVRLHRRLDQGTDRASLMGEIEKQREQLEKANRAAKNHLGCKGYAKMLNHQVDALLDLVPDRSEGIRILQLLRSELLSSQEPPEG